MRQYLDFLRDIRKHGVVRQNRTGIDTKAVFGRQLRYDMANGFPLLTTKRLHIKSIVHELLWFLRGDTHLAYLHEHGITIWDEWADATGDLGPIYGAQWRRWGDAQGNSHDQLANLVQDIREDPNSRRLVVSAWNVGELGKMRIAPCPVLLQAWVNDGGLSLQVYQRSADVFLGMPFNTASYALLLHMLAQVTGLVPREFIHTIGDAHIYTNHLEQVETQLKREPRPPPQLKLNPEISNLFDFTHEDIEFGGYNPHPRLPATVAV